MSRANVRFWIEGFVLVAAVLLIGIMGLVLISRNSDFWSYYNRFPRNPSISPSQIKMAFINSDNIPEALDAILYCSLYPDSACCALGGVRYCKI